MSDSTLGPKSRKQEMFLNNDADIVVFGGELRLQLKLS